MIFICMKESGLIYLYSFFDFFIHCQDHAIKLKFSILNDLPSLLLRSYINGDAGFPG